MIHFVTFLTLGVVLCTNSAPGTRIEEKTLSMQPNSDGELVRELSDAELRKIVAEQPLDDPLNAFYDPYEPYRLSTFAYWHPITFPKDHANPPLPVGFLPPNAPPKSFPSDFFFNDDEARRIVLGEHAAAFCPYLRRWREKHPLKPYPVEADFLERHPPIKFTPGKGYDIDQELQKLNDLTRKAKEEILKEAELGNKPPEVKLEDEKQLEQKPQTKEKQQGQPEIKEEPNENSEGAEEADNGKKKRPIWDLGVLMDIIERVKRSRPDCSTYNKFLERPVPKPQYLTTPPDCLQEVIFYMDALEDIHDPVELEDNIPEIVDKVEFYRHILLKLIEFKAGKKKGKCPFGFKGKNEKTDTSAKIFQGTVPKWAELKPGETIYTSDEDSEWEKIEKYRFPYKQVPFPSIQDTLKKYVSI